MAYLEGKNLDAVYNGASYQMQLISPEYSTSFSHLHNFEPASDNHQVPHYGIFAAAHNWWYDTKEKDKGKVYGNADKNVGPPHFRYPEHVYPMEINDYLVARDISAEDVRSLGPHYEPKSLIESGSH
jgi:hypothetical protein